MTIIAIDPSLTRTALVRKSAGGVTWEVYTTRHEWGLAKRLRTLAVRVHQAVVDTPDVSLVVIEQPGFVSVVRASGTEATQRVIGALLAALPDGRVELVVVTTARSALGIRAKRGKGNAKRAVVAWVEQQGHVLPRSPVAKNPDHDVADAILLAYYAEAHL